MNEPVPAKEPVLVVHGIGERDQNEFFSRVQQLQAEIGQQYAFVPVHWGELAASTLHLDKIMSAKPAGGGPDTQASWGGLFTLIGVAANAADEGFRGLLRAGVSERIVPYLGDIIVYQGIRDQFHRMVRSYLPGGYGTSDRPIKAIGHSLGGVMLFDLAVSSSDRPIWFSHLVTLGSQASFFHLQHRRSELVREYAGAAVTLPPMINAWTNVLDDDDWLSFAVEPIFRLSGGGSPRDRWVDNTAGSYSDVLTLAAHTAYWRNPAVHAIIQEAFSC